MGTTAASPRERNQKFYYSLRLRKTGSIITQNVTINKKKKKKKLNVAKFRYVVTYLNVEFCQNFGSTDMLCCAVVKRREILTAKVMFCQRFR